MPAPHSALPTWDLRPLVKDKSEWASLQTKIRNKTNRFTAYRKKLDRNPTRKTVERALHDLEEIGVLTHRLAAYAGLRFAQNTQDETAKALESEVSQFLAAQGNKKVFFGIWWKNLDERRAQALLPKHADYRYYLHDSRRFKKHILSEKEEQLINLKDTTGGEALHRLYELITTAYTFEWPHNGRSKTLNEEELASYHRSPRPEERVRSYQLKWRRFGQDNGTLGEIYRNIALDAWNENISLRGFKTPLSVRNMDNHLPDEVVETFLRVCEENTTLFQDYFKWKSTFLGYQNSRYHLYAPLPGVRQTYSFADARRLVHAAFEEFSPWFATEAERVIHDNRLDAALRPGKSGGAFCADIPGETNYVHMNYTGKYHDVSILAHELGHAVHHHLTDSHTLFTRHANLPLSETASTFAELLLMEKMMNDAASPAFTHTLLAHQLDDAYASISRQASFCMFEKEAFDMIHAGKTIPDLNAAYMKNLRTQLGNKMEIPREAQYEWTAIPHFFEHPFYVYAYAFGQLLVYALYDRYMREGPAFVADYKKFLSYGGSKDPEDMLLEIGFDARKRKSWQNGFDWLHTKLKTVKKMQK